MLDDYYGFKMQKDVTLSPRRLFDLGIAAQKREGGVLKYALTTLGMKVQAVLGSDPDLAADLLHYLHYSGYQERLTDRKLLWSYRRCCEIVWKLGVAIPASQMASMVQMEITERFPHVDFSAAQGARFNAAAATNVYSWLRSLTPSPIRSVRSAVRPRDVARPELVCLALALIYRDKGFRYGDPVLMDSEFIHEIAGIFFLSDECCSRLLRSGSLAGCLRITDTLNGPSLRLLSEYGISDI
jgi:hypothetical protein